jgi:hypothetical protein
VKRGPTNIQSDIPEECHDVEGRKAEPLLLTRAGMRLALEPIYSDRYTTERHSMKLLSNSTDNTETDSVLRVSGYALLENVSNVCKRVLT